LLILQRYPIGPEPNGIGIVCTILHVCYVDNVHRVKKRDFQWHDVYTTVAAYCKLMFTNKSFFLNHGTEDERTFINWGTCKI
jgi:hypothetical protein